MFYDHNRVVAHVNICLDSNRLAASPAIPATSRNQMYIAAGQSYPAEGFSKTGQGQLKTLCRQPGFSHCSERPSPLFG